jgi:hypothetical protein
MHTTPQQTKQLTNDAPAVTVYRERSILDDMVEETRELVDPFTPAAPSILDAVTEPVAKWSRGRKLVVRNVEVAKQDTDVQSVGGLFGAVDESAEPVAFLHGSQASLPMGAVQTDKSTGCCVCGDGRCNIGPFILTKSKGGR